MGEHGKGTGVSDDALTSERIDELKAHLRSEMRALRGSLSSEERACVDAAICEQVCSLPSYREADVLFAYLSFGAEVETRGIIDQAWRDGKVVALPRCVAPREMRWFRVSSYDGLEKSPLGVEEPRISEDAEVFPAECAHALALVPGLTFDDKGYRLGYGGGFYDAFLAVYPGMSVGLCRSAQRIEDLHARGVIDVHDAPVDTVVSENDAWPIRDL